MTSEPRPHPLSGVDREELSSKIEAVSPEGRPAHPELGPRRIGVLLGGVAGAVLLISLVVALIYSRSLGIGIAVIGIVLFLANPVFWAAVSRARERGRVNEAQKPGEPRSK